jgi:hypothetical protein
MEIHAATRLMTNHERGWFLKLIKYEARNTENNGLIGFIPQDGNYIFVLKLVLECKVYSGRHPDNKSTESHLREHILRFFLTGIKRWNNELTLILIHIIHEDRKEVIHFLSMRNKSPLLLHENHLPNINESLL